MPSRTKTAVVLAGGAAHGAYAVGVMEALFSGRWLRGTRGPLDADVFTGTSVGAYSATVMAQADGAKNLEAARLLRWVWVNRIASIPSSRPNGVFRIRGDLRRYFREPSGSFMPIEDARSLLFSWSRRMLSLGLSKEQLIRRLLRAGYPGDIFCTRPLDRLIDETIHPKAVLNPKADFLRIATTSWDRGHPVVFSNKPPQNQARSDPSSYRSHLMDESNVADAILASAAIPGLFPKISMEDEYFVDGGILTNTPLAPAIHSGAEVVHVIHSQHQPRLVPLGRAPSFFEALERLLSLVPTTLIDWDIERARQAQALSEGLRQHLRGLKREDTPRVPQVLQHYAGLPRLTIHRYFPHEGLGGAETLFDFRQDTIVRLIEQGFQDAVRHDCRINGCLV